MKKGLLILLTSFSLIPLPFAASGPGQPNQKEPTTSTAPSQNKEQANTNNECDDILDDPNSPYPKELGEEAPTGY